MRELYHHPLEPKARYIRLIMAEKQVQFTLTEEPFWLRRPEFLRLSPTGELPVLVDSDDNREHHLSDAIVIGEYLEETAGAPALLGNVPRQRAEVRRLVQWFMNRFTAEVASPLLNEKVWKRLASGGQPDTFVLRAASQNMHYHLAYIQYLTERQRWLAGDQMSLADLAAAAALSSMDYLGAVSWDAAPEAKEWYAKIKSRPAFRSLLTDHLPGLPPARDYTNLDF